MYHSIHFHFSTVQIKHTEYKAFKETALIALEQENITHKNKNNRDKKGSHTASKHNTRSQNTGQQLIVHAARATKYK